MKNTENVDVQKCKWKMQGNEKIPESRIAKNVDKK
jgi:hypothetical protein